MVYDLQKASQFSLYRGGIFDSEPEVLVRVSAVANSFACKRILEVGSGPGRTARLLCGFVPSVEQFHLVDHSDGMVKMAAKEHYDPRVSIWLSDMCNMDFSATQSVDMVYAINSLHQVEALDEAFREISRVLASSGIFFLVTPSATQLSDFALFRCNPDLLAFQRERLIEDSVIRDLAKFFGFGLLSKSNFRNPCKINADVLLENIRNRTLSVLHCFSDKDINIFSDRVEQMKTGRNETCLQTYWMTAYLFQKEK
jgi:SAM-dependent methyltransferase